MLRQIGVFIGGFAALFLAWGAAGAATPARAVFDVTLTGTVTKSWTARHVVEGACDEVTTHRGTWRLSVRTARATRVVAVGPSGPGRPARFSPGIVRSIAGSAIRSGSRRIQNQSNQCGTDQTATCTRRRVSFRGATTAFSSPSRAKLRFGRLQGIKQARSLGGTCPVEDPEIRGIRTELTLADGPLTVGDLFDRDVPRFFISGNTTQETSIEGEYDGKVVESVRWTLTFTRLKR